jgi:hypothetical protein
MTIIAARNIPCLSSHYRPVSVTKALYRYRLNLRFHPCIELQEKHDFHTAISRMNFRVSAIQCLANPRSGNNHQIPIACLPTLAEFQHPAVSSTEAYQTPAR